MSSMMKSSKLVASLFIFLAFHSFRTLSSAAHHHHHHRHRHRHRHHDFLHCLYSQTNATSTSTSLDNLIYTPTSPSYSSVFQFSIRNQRFNLNLTSSINHPIAIITPHTISHIQSTVLCSRNHGDNIQLRLRSGGHDFEGLSYVSSSSLPFVLLDLVNLRNVTVDVPAKSAWVQAGAVLAEVYHAIASATPILAFPAGICPTVGVGGHISGGGNGFLLRKYGTAADNILDALLVDAEGRLLDRATMGEDVFWAIRGGGGNTYGIVVSWKLNLVDVPARVTVFTVSVTSHEKVRRVVDKYQRVVDKLSDDLLILLTITRVNSTNLNALFQALYLGKTEHLVKEMESRFPEMELREKDCKEMSWIETVLYFAGYPSNASYEVLLKSRTNAPVEFQKVKAKSDYVERPLPSMALQRMLKSLFEIEMGPGTMFQIVPHGGRMSRISNSSIPYPHRAGNMYKIQYFAGWVGKDKATENRNLRWIKRLYKFMTPFVSKNPRGAYANSRDLDLGTNDPHPAAALTSTSYELGKVWGEKYYKHNFERLARVKATIDPTNFFRNEQSVPALPTVLSNHP